MRLPNATHESRPWRIHEIVPDFTLEDVWALPVQGDAEDFETLLELMAASDPADAESAADPLPLAAPRPPRQLVRPRQDLGAGRRRRGRRPAS